MKLKEENINCNYLLPLCVKPRKVMGALIVPLDEIKNRAGDVIPKYEVCELTQSFRGYGIRTIDVQDDGRKHEVHRISHYDVRFVRPELTTEDLKKLAV